MSVVEFVGLIKIFIVFLHTTLLLANELETDDETKLKTAHTGLPNGVTTIEGNQYINYINVLPDITSLELNQCSCSNKRLDKTRDKLDGYEAYIQKIDDKLRAFMKAIGFEKIARKAMSSSIEDLLEETQRKYLDMIETSKILTERNTAHTGNNTQNTESLKVAMRNIRTIDRESAEEVANISQGVEDVIIEQSGAMQKPSFVCQWFPMASQNPSLAEHLIEHGLKELPVKVDVQIKSTSRSGLKVIKLEYILRLKIKRNDWLIADTCLSSQSLHFILSLRMNSRFITSRPDDEWIFPGDCVFKVMMMFRTNIVGWYIFLMKLMYI